MIANDAIVEGEETFTVTIITTGTYAPGAGSNYLRVNIADGNTEGSESGHIHLISENMAQTSIFLGNDDKYVKVAADDQIYIKVPNADTSGTSQLWTFGTDGSTTLPIGVSIDESSGSQFPRIIADPGKAFSLQGQGSTGSAAIAWLDYESTSSQYAAVGVNKVGGSDATTYTSGGDYSAGGVIITQVGANKLIIQQGNWSTSTATILALPSSTVIDVVYFGSASYELTLTSGFVYNEGQDWYEATYTSLTPDPGYSLDGYVTTISFGGSSGLANVVLTAGSSTPTLKVWRFDETGTTTFPDGTTSTGAVIRAVQGSSYIIQTLGSAQASPSNVLSTFEFGVDGTLTFPDATVQTTAWTGTVAYSNVTGAPAEFNTGTLVTQAVNVAGGIVTATSVSVSATTAAVSTLTGALQVAGGAGIRGSIFAGGLASITGNILGYGSIVRTGNRSLVAWGSNGAGLVLQNATFTDTSSAGTQATSTINYIGQPTLAFSSTTTVTQANTLYISSAPVAGTNATITTGYALNVAAGASHFGGNVVVDTYVTQATKPAFRVIGGGTTNNLSPTQNTTGVLNGNNYVVDYNQGGHLSTSTGVFTAPVAGLYQINVVARNAGYEAGISQVSVTKNRTVSDTIQVMIEWASTSTMNHAGGSTVAKLAVGDTLELKVYAGQINFDLNDNWSVAFLG
jgi:hypothetical protein